MSLRHYVILLGISGKLCHNHCMNSWLRIMFCLVTFDIPPWSSWEIRGTGSLNTEFNANSQVIRYCRSVNRRCSPGFNFQGNQALPPCPWPFPWIPYTGRFQISPTMRWGEDCYPLGKNSCRWAQWNPRTNWITLHFWQMDDLIRGEGSSVLSAIHIFSVFLLE